MLVHRVLGIGGFGRVDLVTIPRLHSSEHKDNPGFFALKMISKANATACNQQEHVLCEMQVMKRLASPFCAPLYRTFRDSRYIYMLSEFLQGGELWRHLRQAPGVGLFPIPPFSPLPCCRQTKAHACMPTPTFASLCHACNSGLSPPSRYTR